MSTPRILRHDGPEALVERAAQRLLDQIVALQATQETVHLCLAAGRTANRVHEAFADLIPGSDLDASKLHLWWGDEQFLPTTDPGRHSLQSLSILARTLSLNTSQTHPMPTSNGQPDPSAAAYAYSQELGDVVFDICMLGMGPDGNVASIFPNHRSSEPTSAMVIGVTDSPKPPSERMSLTTNAFNRSQRVWFWVDGSEKAAAVQKALAGDPTLPASQVRGQLETLWFVDRDSAALLPQYRCPF